MPLNVIEANGRKYVFGRKRPSGPEPCFKLQPLLAATVPAPPAAIPAPSDAAISAMFKNDQLGDCVIAGQYHFLGNITAAAGSCFVATDAQVVKDYEVVGGYNPLNPLSDQGCNISDAMAYYASTGYANGAKNLGYFAFDPTNTVGIKQIVWICGGINIGASMPNAWVNPMPQKSGFTWDVAGSPNDMNGHDFEAVGYDSKGLIIDTWGMTGWLTWGAVAKYLVHSAGGELWARICQAMINPSTSKTAAGYSWFDSCSFFNALGGAVVIPPNPNPNPTPTPPPTPTPTPSPVTVNVPFGVYDLTITGTAVTPVPPAVVVPAPVTVTVGGQSLTISAALAGK